MFHRHNDYNKSNQECACPPFRQHFQVKKKKPQTEGNKQQSHSYDNIKESVSSELTNQTYRK